MDSIQPPADLAAIQSRLEAHFQSSRHVLQTGNLPATTADGDEDEPVRASAAASHFGFGPRRQGGGRGGGQAASKRRKVGRGGGGRGRGGGGGGGRDGDDDGFGSFSSGDDDAGHGSDADDEAPIGLLARQRRGGGGGGGGRRGGVGSAPDQADEAKPPARLEVSTPVDAPDLVDAFEALGVADPPHRCFGCIRGRDDSVSFTYEAYKEMESMFASKMLVTNKIELAKEMEEYFEEFIRKPANDPEVLRATKEQPLPAWTAATIYAHFTEHMVDFSVVRLERMRMVSTVVKTIYNRGGLFVNKKRQLVDLATNEVLQEEDLGRQIDPLQWRIFKDALSLEARLYGQNPRTAMFSWTGVGAPQDESVALINMSRKRMHSRNASRLTGTSLSNRSASAGVGSTVQGSTRAVTYG